MKQKLIVHKFPISDEGPAEADSANPAIMLYGRRFYKDQTPVEYLAEFLLVFASPKCDSKADSYRFLLAPNQKACYWPEDRIALKLFSFFPASKLETRHPVHQKQYRRAIDDIQSQVQGSGGDKEDAVRLIQSLFAGFVGVAKNRTWVTHSFLPVASSLLAREVDWLHSRATKNKDLTEWQDSSPYFATDRHNFMARGGELLFLQIAHLFSSEHESLDVLMSQPGYSHLQGVKLNELQDEIERHLQAILKGAVGPLDALSKFLEKALEDTQILQKDKVASLGWVPTSSLPESLLFAWELNNICRSKLGALEKLDLLQLLCCMQVLRSLCFQARRIDTASCQTNSFWGNYAWIIADGRAKVGCGTRKLAQSSFEQIEEMLYRVLRLTVKAQGQVSFKFAEADKHGFLIFRKIAKEIGLVVPRTGAGQRFVLALPLLRFLVAALLAPGERVRLTEFYSRAFAHYGIALGERQVAAALTSSANASSFTDYAVAADTAWIEEALQQGGFLEELSDAVSIVYNPGS